MKGAFLSTSVVNFSKELNQEQWEAVQATTGPVLILAGAGSGKTRALTYRIAYLVATELAHPSEILAVTFTNKAAKEMLERTTNLLSKIGATKNHPEPLWISTFHSSCVRILRRHAQAMALQPGFAIYDDGDQLSVIKKVCQNLNINDKIFPPKSFQFQINQAKNQYIAPSEMKKQRRHAFDERVADVYSGYEQEMLRSNALDFGDLLFKTVKLFETHPEILELYQNRFKFIMIDEYQDTNRVQYLLVKLLSQKFKNLCVVGDEDQSIYSWRGADITNILNFEHDFPDAKIIKLEQNYRSTKNIVEAASHVIRKNSERKDKSLWTENDAGEPISIREESNEHEEARSVVREIQALSRDDQKSFNEFAVFYRTNAQSRVFEDQLRGHQVPYKLIGGMKFYERAEIKDVISYLKLIVNPKDSVSLKRIINTPTRGIGKTTVEKLEDHAASIQTSLYDGILPALQEKILDRGALRKVLEFYEMLSKLIESQQNVTPREAYHAILDATQYVNKLKAEDNPEAQSRIENLEEFDSALTEFERERGDEATLVTFLEEMALVTDADKHNIEQVNAVTLMTLHVSKGLEFPVVFIVGLEEGLFPSGRSLAELGNDSSEEERRLFYVGMTRAREKLYLSYARMRTVWGSEQMNPPSRFLSEIPDTYIKRSTRLKVPTLGSHFSWRSAQTETLHADDFESEHQQTSPQKAKSDETYFDQFHDVDMDGDMDDELAKGMHVRHPSYGVGIIHGLEGKGETQKVTILFPGNSLKKFVVKFARLERV
jgi:DNA helicase-2/ATP-dependent DNA helicase PcrA